MFYRFIYKQCIFSVSTFMRKMPTTFSYTIINTVPALSGVCAKCKRNNTIYWPINLSSVNNHEKQRQQIHPWTKPATWLR